jgi:hypothetical protein
MVVKMIEINDLQYSSSKIILQKKLREKVKFGSSSNIITFTLITAPYNSSYVYKFVNSNDSVTTYNPDYFVFAIAGKYQFKALERGVNGNYVNYDIYVEIKDDILLSTMPFNTESTELSDNGWGDALSKHINSITQMPTKIIKAVCETELQLGNLCFYKNIYEKITVGFTFLIDNITNCVDTKSKIGIVIDKKELDPLEVDMKKRYSYVILFNGICMINNTNFVLTTDANNNINYDPETHEITIEDKNRIGKYFSTDKILIIENEITYE